MGKHNEFGRLGEQMAVDFLLKNGYEICERNFRYQKAEIDIIARKDGFLVIVEVKSRTGGFTEEISQTISKKKISLLVMAADYYIENNGINEEVRFDLIIIIQKKGGLNLEHVKNAFYFF
ncbi:YraN family protein [Flagellimonas myxillae]|uniref:YraN family protein n=1 Tax=Flagellimonas myxillae TaxID=2942214 RepID=UPI00201F9251|nr:YraN family protein [Muricauda myxillae]MCL6267010.1 YraN family protein [Muricauda myxillae]